MARYAAKGGLRVLLVDKKGELGTPVQCSGAVSANALAECAVPFDAEYIAEPSPIRHTVRRLKRCIGQPCC